MRPGKASPSGMKRICRGFSMDQHFRETFDNATAGAFPFNDQTGQVTPGAIQVQLCLLLCAACICRRCVGSAYLNKCSGFGGGLLDQVTPGATRSQLHVLLCAACVCRRSAGSAFLRKYSKWRQTVGPSDDWSYTITVAPFTLCISGLHLGRGDA